MQDIVGDAKEKNKAQRGSTRGRVGCNFRWRSQGKPL